MKSLTDTVEHLFAETGALFRRKGFDFRPQQLSMARSIAEALDKEVHLIIEAPTGVGKTLAYLLPAILFAVANGRKAIVSTHTKTLQDQLWHQDIPIAKSLGLPAFNVALLKGRRNYLCTTRLRNALAASQGLFDTTEQEELARIQHWAKTSDEGDMEDLGFAPSPHVWEMVCSEKGICSSSSCKPDCFFQRAKKRVHGAHLIVVNHALFFSLMAIHGTDERFIFENDFVIFDEAHMLENVAGSGLGTRLARSHLLAALHRLYNARTKRGLLAKKSPKARRLCQEVENTISEFFELLATSVGSQVSMNGGARQAIRIRRPYIVADTVSSPIAGLLHEITTLAAGLPAEREVQELLTAASSLRETHLLVGEFLEQANPAFTYWIEPGTGSRGNLTLCTSPSSIADILGPALFRDGTSVIMTSATLSIGGALTYFKKRIGAAGINGVVLDSPFDINRQMRVRIARDIGEPDSDSYLEELSAWIRRSVEDSRGRALVLFTSKNALTAAAGGLADDFARLGYTLLVQGAGSTRHALLQQFRDDVSSVLFGLESFWMGVDVPGEALEHVIITRLPFAVPNHPLVEARVDAIEQDGGNAFLEYTLPEAVLKFRQGIGRLIRSQSDRGLVTILDSRILTKSYGRLFLCSLPTSAVELLSRDGDSLPLERTWE